MIARWQQLQSREQRLILVAASVLLFYLAFALVWQPLNSNIAQAQQKVKRQQELQQWLQDKLAYYQMAKQGGQARGDSLTSIVNRTARSNNITVTRMQPQGDELQVWIDEISFNQLLAWLSQLSQQNGLQVKGIDISGSDTAGVVQVRRLQLGK